MHESMVKQLDNMNFLLVDKKKFI